MKKTKQKKQMRITLGILVVLVLLLSTVGIVLGIKNCGTASAPGSSSGTENKAPEYKLPMDTF